jgi:phage baseplate assembly protein W
MAFNFTKLDNPFVTNDKSGSFVFNSSIGVTLPFNIEGGGVFNRSYFSDDQMRTNVINLLSTRKGERLYHIDFGTDLYRLVFEQISDNGELESKIRSTLVSAFDFWTPYVTIRNINIDTPVDSMGTNSEHTLKITLRLQLNPTQANINVVIFIDNQGTLTIE